MTHNIITTWNNMYFRGRTLRNLDTKGRIMLPPDFRTILTSRSEKGKVVLTTYDGCVVGFPYPDWEEFEEKMNRVKNPSKQVRIFRRLVLGGAEEMDVDAQGRVRLSREHMKYAGIDREAILMGQGPRFEIWSPEKLDELLAEDIENVAVSLAESGIDFGF